MKLSFVLLKDFKNFSKLVVRNLKIGNLFSIVSALPTVKTFPFPSFLRSHLQLSRVEMCGLF